MSEKQGAQRRRRGGILEALTSKPDSGFSGDHLTLISSQISELQQAEPTPEAKTPEDQNAQSSIPEELPPPQEQPPVDTTEPIYSDELKPSKPGRVKGARGDKQTGLQLTIQDLLTHGFPHPLHGGDFVMVPRRFTAVLSLAPLSVSQVVWCVLEQTIGWVDETTPTGRREWCRLSIQDFQNLMGISRSQVQRGLAKALEEGFIQRRRAIGTGGAFEYALKWRLE